MTIPMQNEGPFPPDTQLYVTPSMVYLLGPEDRVAAESWGECWEKD